MAILNIGSINVDHTYRVARHPQAGETVLGQDYHRGLGGKGANMSLAAAAAGAVVHHAGAVGQDGAWCRDQLAAAGIDVSDLVVGDTETGHALIVVDTSGENTIVVHSGANQDLKGDLLGRAMDRMAADDWLLLQNETNLVVDAARMARERGLRIAYAAAPFDPAAVDAMLGLADLVAVNAVEAQQLCARSGRAVQDLGVQSLLVTCGADGASLFSEGQEIAVPAFPVTPIDTTGAGDTFLGFFLAGLDLGLSPANALRRASAAAALQVTRPGAGEAIPSGAEVDAFLAERT